MIVVSVATVFKIVELFWTLIVFFLVSVVPHPYPAKIVYCSMDDRVCFAPLLYVSVVGFIAVAVLIAMIYLFIKGRKQPTTDCTIAFAGAAIWFSAAGTVVYIIAGGWTRANEKDIDAHLILLKYSNNENPPAQWCAAAAICILIGFVHVAEGIVACSSPHVYSRVVFPAQPVIVSPTSTQNL